MAKSTRPVSVRLGPREVERLQARADVVSGSLAGVARELIVSGLAGGDSKALADRLMQIERRLAALESVVRDAAAQAERIEVVTRDLRTKFDALLSALSSHDGGAA